MIYACDACRFLFKRVSEPGQCPDCGKYNIRPATKAEVEEFNSRSNNIEEIYAKENKNG